jgi:hypothetical protein
MNKDLNHTVYVRVSLIIMLIPTSSPYPWRDALVSKKCKDFVKPVKSSLRYLRTHFTRYILGITYLSFSTVTFSGLRIPFVIARSIHIHLHILVLLSASFLCALFMAFSDASPAFSQGSQETIIKEVRAEFHQALSSEVGVTSALKVVEHHLASAPSLSKELRGVLAAYKGALTAMRAQYTSWPLRKKRYAEEGVTALDASSHAQPNLMEIKILRVAVLNALPSFFGRNDESVKEGRELLTAVRTQCTAGSNSYKEDPALVKIGYNFLIERSKGIFRDEKEREALKQACQGLI